MQRGGTLNTSEYRRFWQLFARFLEAGRKVLARPPLYPTSHITKDPPGGSNSNQWLLSYTPIKIAVNMVFWGAPLAWEIRYVSLDSARRELGDLLSRNNHSK